jgi:hypothetical protein
VEVKGAVILYTLAGLSVTFAGFSALLLAIRQAAGARLSLLDRFLARTVLIHLFILTSGALLPPVLALYELSEAVVWKISAVVFALPMLAVLLTYWWRRRKAVGTPPPAIVTAIYIVLGSAALGAMLIYVLAGFSYAAAAYITALLVSFFTLAFAFVVAVEVILQQPADGSR